MDRFEAMDAGEYGHAEEMFSRRESLPSGFSYVPDEECGPYSGRTDEVTCDEYVFRCCVCGIWVVNQSGICPACHRGKLERVV